MILFVYLIGHAQKHIQYDSMFFRGSEYVFFFFFNSFILMFFYFSTFLISQTLLVDGFICFKYVTHRSNHKLYFFFFTF